MSKKENSTDAKPLILTVPGFYNGYGAKCLELRVFGTRFGSYSCEHKAALLRLAAHLKRQEAIADAAQELIDQLDYAVPEWRVICPSAAGGWGAR